jgi:hypothetical protein
MIIRFALEFPQHKIRKKSISPKSYVTVSVFGITSLEFAYVPPNFDLNSNHEVVKPNLCASAHSKRASAALSDSWVIQLNETM